MVLHGYVPQWGPHCACPRRPQSKIARSRAFFQEEERGFATGCGPSLEIGMDGPEDQSQTVLVSD